MASQSKATSPAPWVLEWRRRRTVTPKGSARATPQAETTIDGLLTSLGVASRARRVVLQKALGVDSDSAVLQAHLSRLKALLWLDDAEFSSLLGACATGDAADAAVLRMSPGQVAQALLALRSALPYGSDASALVTAHPALLLAPAGRILSSMSALRAQAAERGGVEVDVLIRDFPSAFGELLGELIECDGQLDMVHPFLRAWMFGNLGVR
jgi:hypothetical protein